MSIRADDFKRANSRWPVVKAEWTENGRAVKRGPANWNYMRVKLKSGEEFLLSSAEVKEIGEMSWK